MGAVCEGNTHYDWFRRRTHLGRSDLRPDGGIHLRRQLDPDGMGDLAGSSTGITERRSQIPTGRPTNHDSSYARSRGGSGPAAPLAAHLKAGSRIFQRRITNWCALRFSSTKRAPEDAVCTGMSPALPYRNVIVEGSGWSVASTMTLSSRATFETL